MVRAVADTHVLVWYAFGDSRLSSTALEFIEKSASEGSAIAISTISLVEITYLMEKGRLPAATLSRIRDLFDEGGPFEPVALTPEIAGAVASVPRDEVPDLPDRVIAATAVHLGVPLLSRDRKILASSVTTIW